MKGNPQIISTLNSLLADELAARDQYLLHAHKLAHWGYARLAARLAHEVDDEKMHAETLIKRILFLEGVPNMTPSAVTIGDDVPSIFKLDLDVELKVRANLNSAAALCEKERDFGTRELLMPLLHDTEVDHIDWLEEQLGLIAELGLPEYLAQQLR
jgi:bacterioferritin